ncbi:hypothetical protein [Cupriavidus plantarum]|uniref:hypothetical protein n=1 Tax=Cupriavidus plantarum TaxID=942865 RepID=UPI000F101FAE|nr:hypothetical protein [Cupriavidus plantarum]RLK31767.1 hypothetical protein C7417_4747 [Cupriavidus plantarum]
MKYLYLLSPVLAISLVGCGTVPENLNRPASLSCIEVPQGTEGHEYRGLLKMPWITRLSAGPYISELEDEAGTYYRAPPGGVYIAPPNPPSDYFQPMTYDGGLWVPRDGNKPVNVYFYSSTRNAVVKPLPQGASCATAVATRNVAHAGTQNVSYKTADAQANDAVASVVANVMTTGTPPVAALNVAQSAVAGGVGGAIAGGVVAGFIALDAGKIFFRLPMEGDPAFVSALERLGREAKPVPVDPR